MSSSNPRMTSEANKWWARALIWALVLTVVLRLGAAVGTAYRPIINEKGLPVSPLHVAPGSDLQFYLNSRDLYLSGAVISIVGDFARFYKAGKEPREGLIVSAPVLPLLLAAFDYRPGNTLPLTTVFVLLGIVLSAAWLRHFEIRGMPPLWLWAFPFLPHLIWYTINVGSDFLGALFFAGFYLSYFAAGPARRRLAWGLVFLILLLLTRPNGVSLLIFVVIDQLLLKRHLSSSHRNWLIGASLVVAAPFVVFYFPYLFAYVSGSLYLPIFGIPTQQYLGGVFDDLPLWLNLLLSWLSLFGGKLLYLVGLRPSYADTSLPVVLARAAPGLIFLPGIIHIFVVGDRAHRLLTALFLLPIFLGTAQDRYILPIQPLLFLHGTMVYTGLWLALRRRLWRGRAG